MAFDLRSEASLFAAALRLLTRVPMPAVALEPDWLARSARYFPLVGCLVGLAAAAVFLAASRIWPLPLPALFALAATLLLTGALHEDGLADTADGLGGGRTREAALAIMKDSRIGAFGVLALGLCLAGRVAALGACPNVGVAASAIVGAQAGARLVAVMIMAFAPYGGDPLTAKFAHGAGRPGGIEIALATLFALAPLVLLEPPRALAGILLGGAVAAVLVWRSWARLGGYTGDILGAAAALYETGFLLGAAIRGGSEFSA